jgi:hypothetical protein
VTTARRWENSSEIAQLKVQSVQLWWNYSKGGGR